MLFQLQVLFGYLQESQKKYFDACGFCDAYKDFEGRPMDYKTQMDANEFCNVLFDKLENALKSSPQERLLQELFGGKISNQLIGKKDCNHSREREESFYVLSLEVLI